MLSCLGKMFLHVQGRHTVFQTFSICCWFEPQDTEPAAGGQLCAYINTHICVVCVYIVHMHKCIYIYLYIVSNFPMSFLTN